MDEDEDDEAMIEAKTKRTAGRATASATALLERPRRMRRGAQSVQMAQLAQIAQMAQLARESQVPARRRAGATATKKAKAQPADATLLDAMPSAAEAAAIPTARRRRTSALPAAPDAPLPATIRPRRTSKAKVRAPGAPQGGVVAPAAVEPAIVAPIPAPAPADLALPLGSAIALPRRRHGIAPENTVFVSLCFEGPDVYSTAGGLGTRVTALTESLARQGYDTHLIFVGDPGRPGSETLYNGKLHLTRWGQAISRYYPNGVYEGEEHKLYDYTQSVPQHIYERIAAPAVAAGKTVAIIGEDWHTAEAMCRTSDLLHWHGIRQRCLLMWNCNSLKSLHRIDWGRLAFTTSITTVSRYMKQQLWRYGVNPLVIPNGIPGDHLAPVNEADVEELRAIVQRGDPERLFLFKIGRFDPDKRWLMAIEAAARLKAAGRPISLVIRGGMEPHGAEVLERARQRGLSVHDVAGGPTTPAQLLDTLRCAAVADVYNLQFFLPSELARLCYAAADATLANSGHEPFGLVGLEVMAAGGIAFTGSTGEDYAISFENAVALETDDPDELVGYLQHIVQHPDERAKLRAGGRRTAAAFVWEEVIGNLTAKLAYLARKQNIALA